MRKENSSSFKVLLNTGLGFSFEGTDANKYLLTYGGVSLSILGVPQTSSATVFSSVCCVVHMENILC